MIVILNVPDFVFVFFRFDASMVQTVAENMSKRFVTCARLGCAKIENKMTKIERLDPELRPPNLPGKIDESAIWKLSVVGHNQITSSIFFCTCGSEDFTNHRVGILLKNQTVSTNGAIASFRNAWDLPGNWSSEALFNELYMVVHHAIAGLCEGPDARVGSSVDTLELRVQRLEKLANSGNDPKVKKRKLPN